MNRRSFLSSLVAVPAAAWAEKKNQFRGVLHNLYRRVPDEYPIMNWIDLPEGEVIEQVISTQKSTVYAFTGASLYRIDGCYGPYKFSGNRFWAMEMPQTDSLPCVTRDDKREYMRNTTGLTM